MTDRPHLGSQNTPAAHRSLQIEANVGVQTMSPIIESATTTTAWIMATTDDIEIRNLKRRGCALYATGDVPRFVELGGSGIAGG